MEFRPLIRVESTTAFSGGENGAQYDSKVEKGHVGTSDGGRVLLERAMEEDPKPPRSERRQPPSLQSTGPSCRNGRRVDWDGLFYLTFFTLSRRIRGAEHH